MDLMETTVPPEHRAPTAHPASLDRLVWMAPREDPDQLDPKEMTDSPERLAKTEFLVCQEPKETPECQVFLEKMDDWELKEKEAWMASQEDQDVKVFRVCPVVPETKEILDRFRLANSLSAERRDHQEEMEETASLDSPDRLDPKASLDWLAHLDSPDKTVSPVDPDRRDATDSTDRKEMPDRRESKETAAFPAAPASSSSDTVNPIKCLLVPTTTSKCGTDTVYSTWKETNALTDKISVTRALA